MPANDHLDRETSVSAEITPTGVKAAAKSRFVAGVDRLGGNLVELMNASIEAWTEEKRARTNARVRAIEAVTEIGLDRLKTDREFAERAMRNHLESIFVQRQNKDAVLGKAIEDLRRQPPSEEEATSGPDTLDENFVHRFERYAGSATTDELREKWGRVFAAEVRKPNTFSARVLRIVDEMDQDVAILFEKLCESRLDNVLPKSLVGQLGFDDQIKMTEAGLLVEPGLGQIRRCLKTTSSDNTAMYFWSFGNIGVALTEQETRPGSVKNNSIHFDENLPTIPIYVLTDVGTAISSILPDKTPSAIDALADKLSEAVPTSPVWLYVRKARTDTHWESVRTIPAKTPSPSD